MGRKRRIKAENKRQTDDFETIVARIQNDEDELWALLSRATDQSMENPNDVTSRVISAPKTLRR